METNKKAILSLFLALGIFLPSGIFAQAPQAGRQAVYVPYSAVRVVPTAPTPAVVPSTNQVAAANVQSQADKDLSAACQVGATSPGLFLQSGSKVNLNQPAACFSLLGVIRLADSAQRLSVVKAPPLAAIRVTVLPFQIERPDVLPAPLSQSSPILPLAGFSLAAGFFIQKRRLLSAALKVAYNLNKILIISQFQVLRC